MKTSDFNVCSFSFQFLAWQLFLLVNIFRSYHFLKWKHFPQFLRKADWSRFLQSKTHFYHGKRFKAPNNRNSDTGKMRMKPSIYVFRCWGNEIPWLPGKEDASWADLETNDWISPVRLIEGRRFPGFLRAEEQKEGFGGRGGDAVEKTRFFFQRKGDREIRRDGNIAEYFLFSPELEERLSLERTRI